MNKKDLLKSILAVIVTIVLVGFLLSQLNDLGIISLIARIPFIFFLICFFFYFLTYVFKAIRFKILLKGKFNILGLFSIVSVHNLFSNILPLRTGELSYVYILNKKGVKTAEAVSSLMVARISDFLTILILTLTTILIVRDVPKIYWVFFLSLAAITLFFIFFLLISIIFKKNIVYFFEKIIKKFNLRKLKMITFLLEKIKEIVISFRTISQKMFFKALFVSILAFFSQFLFAYTLFRGMGIEIGFFYIILGSMFADLAIFLPIQGVVGFGTIEGMWAVGFFYLGVTKELAISSGFAYHFVVIACFVIFGLYGLMTLRKIKQVHFT